MYQEELNELQERIGKLAQMLTAMSIQLSAAMKMGMTALPKVQQEFETINTMALRLGIATDGSPADKAPPIAWTRGTAEYLDSVRALGELRMNDSATGERTAGA